MSKVDKVFINGLFFREKSFDWGTILKCDIDVNKLIAQLQELKNDKGYVSIDIKSRKNVEENGLSHYAEQNTFIPKEATQKIQQGNNSDDLPF